MDVKISLQQLLSPDILHYSRSNLALTATLIHISADTQADSLYESSRWQRCLITKLALIFNICRNTNTLQSYRHKRSEDFQKDQLQWLLRASKTVHRKKFFSFFFFFLIYITAQIEHCIILKWWCLQQCCWKTFARKSDLLVITFLHRRVNTYTVCLVAYWKLSYRSSGGHRE